MAEHTARKLSYWRSALTKPLADRIGPASPELVDFLTQDNVLNGYTERPRSIALDESFLKDARSAFLEIPKDVRGLFEKRLVGIYFLEDMGGTGYTDYVKNSAGENVAAFIVLDAKVLKNFTANAWATWKENTPFKQGHGYVLTAKIEDAGFDNRKNAIQYILLHELGHVLSLRGNIHPPWDLPFKPEPAGKYPFWDLSWALNPKTLQPISLFDGAFTHRKDVVYYFGAQLLATDMVPTYTRLKATNFPTLYAATRPGDDFAESFASYVHTVRMGRPWQISIEHDGQLATTLSACWNESRCVRKRLILEQALSP